MSNNRVCNFNIANKLSLSVGRVRNAITDKTPDSKDRVRDESVSIISGLNTSVLFTIVNGPGAYVGGDEVVDPTTQKNRLYALMYCINEKRLTGDGLLEAYMSMAGLLFPDFLAKLNVREDGLGIDTEVQTFDLYRIPEDHFSVWMEQFTPADHRPVLAYFGVFSILLGKQLNTENHKEWLKNRARGACSKAGCPLLEDVICRIFPDQPQSESFYQRMASQWRLRALIYYTIKAMITGNGVIVDIGKYVLQFLAWTESRHVHRIIDTLTIRHPEMLRISEFSSELIYLQSALSYLAEFKDEAPYFSIITDLSSDRPTHSQNFRIMSAVAWHIYTREMTSSKTKVSHYKGTQLDESHPQVASAIRKYLAMSKTENRSNKQLLGAVYDQEDIEKLQTEFEGAYATPED